MAMTFARRVDRRKLTLLVTFARGRDVHPHRMDGLQEELREVAESGGFLPRNASLREQAKDLSESAVHAGGGGEVAAGGIEFGKVACPADDGTPR